jgi:hypothetical protein
MFLAATIPDGGYDLFCKAVGRQNASPQAAARNGVPYDQKKHRKAAGACIIENFGNANRNYSRVTQRNRHNIMLIRFEDFFAAKLFHPILIPKDPQPWQRFAE